MSQVPPEPLAEPETMIPDAGTSVAQPTGGEVALQLDGASEASVMPQVGGGMGLEERTEKKKKRKGKKSLLARGDTALPKKRGTGFEEYFADPPMTPGEYWEEKCGIYDFRRPFHERIEECIQRFKARRRMDGERARLFTNYLALGGIDTQQRQFTGTAGVDFNKDGEGYDTNELRTMSANDVITRGGAGGVSKFYNPTYPEHWDVDFEGVVAGFLSDSAPMDIGVEEEAINKAIDTILNFLKYVLLHEVCPEYDDNVKAACKVCEDAKEQLPLCDKIGQAAPGDFNLAARLLFCKDKKENWEFDYATDVPESFDAERVFKATIAFQLDEDCAKKFRDLSNITVTHTYEDTFVVKAVILPTTDEKRMFAGIKDKAGKPGSIGPTGLLVVNPCVIEDAWDNHPTLAEGRPDAEDEEGFLVDEKILKHLRPGMKLRLVVCALNVDTIKFIKDLRDVYPTFHTFLPQSLMLHWKDPAPNTRPAPSVEDPDAEDRVAGREMRKEVQ